VSTMRMYRHDVAARCGLDAAAALQWLVEQGGGVGDGWIPRSRVVAMNNDLPFLSVTTITLKMALLVAAGFVETAKVSCGNRAGDRVHYRAVGELASKIAVEA
jgi:hypothetical protein